MPYFFSSHLGMGSIDKKLWYLVFLPNIFPFPRGIVAGVHPWHSCTHNGSYLPLGSIPCVLQEHPSGFSAIPLTMWLRTMTSPWPGLWPCASDSPAQILPDPGCDSASGRCQTLAFPIALLSVTSMLCWDVPVGDIHIPRAGHNHHPSGTWLLNRRVQLLGDLNPPC